MRVVCVYGEQVITPETDIIMMLRSFHVISQGRHILLLLMLCVVSLTVRVRGRRESIFQTKTLQNPSVTGKILNLLLAGFQRFFLFDIKQTIQWAVFRGNPN